MKDGRDFAGASFKVADSHEPPPPDAVEAPARIFGITPDHVLAPTWRLVGGRAEFI